MKILAFLSIAGLVSVNALAYEAKFKTKNHVTLSVGDCAMSNEQIHYGRGLTPQANLASTVCQEYITYDIKEIERFGPNKFEAVPGTQKRIYEVKTIFESFDDVLVYHPEGDTSRSAIAVSAKCEARRAILLQTISDKLPNNCVPINPPEAQ